MACSAQRDRSRPDAQQDPSPIIAMHWQPLSVTNLLTHLNSLTKCCVINLIDVTLACEDSNSKLFEVVTVAHVDDEDPVGNSLLHTSELRLGNKAKLLFRL